MRNRTSYEPGVFCWADVVTNDIDAARSFYAELFGWDYDDGDGYVMARLDGELVAGLTPGDSLPHWQSYVAVDSAADALGRAEEAGATPLGPVHDLGSTGTAAHFTDPQGAVACVWQAGDTVGAERVNQPGALCWNDLMTTDVGGAVDFYGGLFGWSLTAVEGAPGDRRSISAGDTLNGGIAEAAAGQPASWLACFATDDVPASLATATGAGGRAVTDVLELPTGRFVVVLDPQGAAFGLIDGQMDP